MTETKTPPPAELYEFSEIEILALNPIANTLVDAVAVAALDLIESPFYREKHQAQLQSMLGTTYMADVASLRNTIRFGQARSSAMSVIAEARTQLGWVVVVKSNLFPAGDTKFYACWTSWTSLRGDLN